MYHIPKYVFKSIDYDLFSENEIDEFWKEL